jgi:hypothetical protein
VLVEDHRERDRLSPEVSGALIPYFGGDVPQGGWIRILLDEVEPTDFGHILDTSLLRRGFRIFVMGLQEKK